MAAGASVTGVTCGPISGRSCLAPYERLCTHDYHGFTIGEVRLPLCSAAAMPLTAWLPTRHASHSVAPWPRPAPVDPCHSIFSGLGMEEGERREREGGVYDVLMAFVV
ncbi:hypothetical protein EYF80_067455 [Liparis tanakae]|uniref:Uncharacterized protein n=1 Tax=Liparis tanakae TaxID=230148 RepID=A0A4Z2E0W3_9TELE|nr:hypothetical protein EYF80_067455 [Liparis tanakae]